MKNPTEMISDVIRSLNRYYKLTGHSFNESFKSYSDSPDESTIKEIVDEKERRYRGLSEDKYYEMIQNFQEMNNNNYLDVASNWLDCFGYILKKISPEYRISTIKSLFFEFDMSNWTALHLENTEYKDYDYDQLYNEFANQASVNSDRMSYDRLFRTHYLFLQYYKKLDVGISMYEIEKELSLNIFER